MNNSSQKVFPVRNKAISLANHHFIKVLSQNLIVLFSMGVELIKLKRFRHF